MLKKVRDFLKKDDHPIAWVINTAIFFLILIYIIQPTLIFLTGTAFPVVAVVSESMEHSVSNGHLCGYKVNNFKDSFEDYWDVCGQWYETNKITKFEFENYIFNEGFNKGDVILIKRPNNLQKGDVIVFNGGKEYPIIHRIVNIQNENIYTTKGDHNPDINYAVQEHQISEERIMGKAYFKIPYIGYIKIWFVNILYALGINFNFQ